MINNLCNYAVKNTQNILHKSLIIKYLYNHN
jgi:hypothetical protein